MSENGPLHSERPTPASLSDPDENLSLSQLTERDAREFAQDVTQKLDALITAPTPPLDTPAVPTRPTPEQISAQIIAEDCASPCLPPFAALQAVCAQIAAAHEEVKTLTTALQALDGQLTIEQRERAALQAIITRQRQDLDAARTALVALDGDGNAPDLAQAIRDLVAARDEGMTAVKAALAAEGYPGNPLDAIRVILAERTDLKKDRDCWKRQAETSAASYRHLSRRVPSDQQDQTVEVKVDGS